MTDGLIIDLFAGGGGASTGIEMALGRHVDIAVDHDPEAIRIHKTNHPGTLHLTEDVFRVNLQEYVKGRHVALMWASPDCTQFSRAKGGKPREKGQRVLPWAVHMHVAALKPDVVIMENVEEIQKWGPLDGNGYPVWERAGEDYKKFICAMSALGYVSDSRELVAADYGAPTTRKRWYAVFWRDGRAVTFPERTHSRGGINGLKPWEPICKYLDLQDFGKSIFGRKKPLAENTMKRIARGLGKFVSDNPETLNSDIPAVLQEMFGGQPVQGTSRGNTPEMHMDVTVYHGVLRMRHRAGYKGTTAYNSDERTVCVNHSGWEQTCNTGFFLRMLKPRELMLGQGFPEDYIMDHDYTGKRIPVSQQVAKIGNSVVPVMAQKLVEVNCPYLKSRTRMENPCMDYSEPQNRFA